MVCYTFFKLTSFKKTHDALPFVNVTLLDSQKVEVLKIRSTCISKKSHEMGHAQYQFNKILRLFSHHHLCGLDDQPFRGCRTKKKTNEEKKRFTHNEIFLTGSDVWSKNQVHNVILKNLV